MKLGVMQGRLSPPVDGRIQAFPADWAREFTVARALGLDFIEWCYTGADPEVDPTAMRDVVRETGVTVGSICADYFQSHRLIKDGRIQKEAAAHLLALLLMAAAVNARYVMLPFVGRIRGVDPIPVGQGEVEWLNGSRLDGERDRLALVDLLTQLAPTCARLRIHLVIETDLSPSVLQRILVQVGSLWIGTVYDTGDRAAGGYLPRYDLLTQGRAIQGVHLKDRAGRGGTTVPLGRGSVRFDKVFTILHRIGYDGPLTLQVARGPVGEEPAWVATQAELIRMWWERFRPIMEPSHEIGYAFIASAGVA